MGGIMDEVESLRARLIATNQVILEMIDKDVSNRMEIAGLRQTISILQNQLLDATRASSAGGAA